MVRLTEKEDLLQNLTAKGRVGLNREGGLIELLWYYSETMKTVNTFLECLLCWKENQSDVG